MKFALHWKILIGLGLGIGVGLAIKSWSPEIQRLLDPDGDGQGFGPGLIAFLTNLVTVAGELFKRALQFIAVPIILFALILAIGSLGDLRALGRIGGKTIGIFLCTATLSVVVGLVLVNVIRPGGERFISADARAQLSESMDPTAATKLTTAAKSTKPWDLIKEIVPINPFDALARGDMLQIVVLALLLGIALSLLPKETSAPVLAVVRGLAEAFTSIVRGIMHLAPYGVFCLIVPIVATLGFGVLSSLGAYCVTVLIGLAIIQFAIYGAVVKVFSGMRLRDFYRGIAQVQVVAFSSSSSAATLPVTIQNVRDRLGVPADITGFVCAMGAKINMDGTALMQAIAVVFLAQFYQQDLTLAQQASIVLTAVVAAIGSPGIPSGGMVMLVIVLQTYGVNPAGIAMILAVDRVLDMCRTIVNVTGDAAVAVAVAASEKRLGPLPPPAATT
ncbi:MAG: dicarboxylate/amino acid:cation symporter [Phycisphaerales bacterium]